MAALVTWSADLELGNERVDTQHKRLIETVGELAQAVAEGAGAARVEAVSFFLVDYVEHHFTDEEALMEAAGYPGLSLHHDVHRELTASVEDKVQRYMAGETVDMDAFLSFLNRWLIEHITGMDRQFAEWSRAR